jgi:hypothetical protein
MSFDPRHCCWISAKFNMTADVPGAVIVGAGTGGPAIEVGDRVVQADGQPVADAAALDRIVAGRQPGTNLVLGLQSLSGQAKTATVDVYLAPRVIGLAEQGVLANRILLDLRARLAESRDPFEQSVIRLNTAVALARAGDWAGARAELMRVQLPDRPGVANGTVQYLLGLSAAALGSRAEAEAAFTAAAASASLLTEDGLPVKDLAAARLAELRGPAR